MVKSLRMNQFCGNSDIIVTIGAIGDLADSKIFAAFSGLIVSLGSAVRCVICLGVLPLQSSGVN
jgi:hypothetical protein